MVHMDHVTLMGIYFHRVTCIPTRSNNNSNNSNKKNDVVREKQRTMLMLFSVDARHHGTGAVKYAWDPHGKYVASTGSSRVAHIFGRRGKLVDQIVPPSPRY